jgi:hemerythrin-like domain-containing protein
MTTGRLDRDERARVASPHDPIEFILTEHLNHRRMCNALVRLAGAASFDAEQVAALGDFIRFDLTLHVIDEEEDLFPLLRQRCLPDDGIDEVLERLTDEHAEDKELSIRVRDVINACLIQRVPPSAIEGGVEALLNFAAHEKRHLILENAVIVPLARRRLTAQDMETLSRRLLARRRRLAAPES